MSKMLISLAILIALVGCKTESKTTKPGTSITQKVETKEIKKVAQPDCKPGLDACFLERLGGVKIDLFETGGAVSSVIKELGEPDTKSERAEMEATGDIVETWTWIKKGISMQVAAADMKADPTTILSMTVMVTSPFKTDRGIGIGSTVKEVEKAYAGAISEPLSEDQSTIVAGSIYDGIFFDFVDDKVNQIFVGAGAE